MYLDKFYVEMHSLANLTDQGYKIFKEVVFNPLCDEVTKSIADYIKQQRIGMDEADILSTQDLLRNSVRIYLTLSKDKLVTDGFMPRVQLDKNLIDETRSFYHNKSQEIITSMNLVDYLVETSKNYAMEQRRTELIFNWDIQDEILKTFRSEMLVKPQAALLNKEGGFKYFVLNKDFTNLKLLYTLYKEEPDHIKPICEMYRDLIKQQGQALLAEVQTEEVKEQGIKEIITKSGVITKVLGLLKEHLDIV